VDRQRLVSKIVHGWNRDRSMSMAERLRKGARLLSETAVARVALRGCAALGSGARVSGRVVVENPASISIGSGFVVHAGFLPVELRAGPEGRIEIGDDVWLNFGTVLAGAKRIRIGNRVMFGQHCIVSDVDIPESVAATDAAEAKEITIADDVWLAGRVTITPGVTIGARSVITAGSVVTSDIPAGVVAGGSPARVLRNVDQHAERSNGASGPATSHEVPANEDVRPAVEPAKPAFRGILASDFTIDELAEELASKDVLPSARATIAPFGQVTQVLLAPPAEDTADFAVVWTRPEGAVPSFDRVLSFENVEEDALLEEVDAFCKLIEQAAPKYRAVFVPTWTVPPWLRGLGMLDMAKQGSGRALLAMNLRLSRNLSELGNVFVLDASRWWRAAARANANPRAWYLGKMAVPRSVLAEAASDVRAALAGLTGGAKKLLVVDLDETLWGGIVGDVGWENLRLGGIDGTGEAFVAFQRAIKDLKRRGVIVAIASKNEESVALEAIRSHPEMVLREGDFVAWRINWRDKAANIAELAGELNLGLQSVVFIDDNPVERARVREALPEVFVPEWPDDKLLYPSALSCLRCFDLPSLSREDLERTRLYAEERQRENLQKQVGSVEEWLKSLNMKVRVEPLSQRNLQRAAQLLNKTNQLNLTTRRLTEAELVDWASSSKRALWTVNVSDRFGDAGLTGLLGLERDAEGVTVVDYLLSCRVMGRKVEETMLHVAVRWAAEQGADRVVARYRPTAKNKPCLTFFRSSLFENRDDAEFTWELQKDYPAPAVVELEWLRSS
jgi:FkbH-like protein